MCDGHKWHSMVGMGMVSGVNDGHGMNRSMVSMSVGIAVIWGDMMSVTLMSVCAQQVSVLSMAVIAILIMSTVTIVTITMSTNNTVVAVMVVAALRGTVSFMSTTVSFCR